MNAVSCCWLPMDAEELQRFRDSAEPDKQSNLTSEIRGGFPLFADNCTCPRTERRICDTTRVNSAERHCFDWYLHGRGFTKINKSRNYYTFLWAFLILQHAPVDRLRQKENRRKLMTGNVLVCNCYKQRFLLSDINYYIFVSSARLENKKRAARTYRKIIQ